MSRSSRSTKPEDDMPPPLEALWRMFRLAYRVEPRLLSVSLGMTRRHRAAVGPHRALARAARRRRRRGQQRQGPRRVARSGRLVGAHLVHAGALRPRAATVPRPGQHRDGGARRVAAGDGRDDRPPRAARARRPARGAAPRDLRSRPPVHVGLLDARLGAAADVRDGAAGHAGQSRPPRAAGLRGADRGVGDRAARRRAGRRGADGTAPPARAQHVPDRHHTRAGQGGPGHRQRRPARSRPGAASGGAWYEPMAVQRWVTSWWHGLAWAAFGLGYVGAIVLTATVLDGTPGQVVLVLVIGNQLSQSVAAAVGELGFLRSIWLDLSRRLMWLEDYAAAADPPGDGSAPDAAHPGSAVRPRVLPLPGLRAARPRRRQPRPPGRSSRRDRGRERRRQVDAGQAARPDVRPRQRPDRGRRRGPGVAVDGRVAVTAGRGVPGLLPVRADRARRHRSRRAAPPR